MSTVIISWLDLLHVHPGPHWIILKQIPSDIFYPQIFQHVRNTVFLLFLYVNVIHKNYLEEFMLKLFFSIRGPRILGDANDDFSLAVFEFFIMRLH